MRLPVCPELPLLQRLLINSLPCKGEGTFVTLPLHLCPSFCVVPFYCLHNVKTVLRVKDLQARVSGDSELRVKRKLWMLLHIFGLLVTFSISLWWRENQMGFKEFVELK